MQKPKGSKKAPILPQESFVDSDSLFSTKLIIDPQAKTATYGETIIHLTENEHGILIGELSRSLLAQFDRSEYTAFIHFFFKDSNFKPYREKFFRMLDQAIHSPLMKYFPRDEQIFFGRDIAAKIWCREHFKKLAAEHLIIVNYGDRWKFTSDFMNWFMMNKERILKEK
jgi:hypothetical protein